MTKGRKFWICEECDIRIPLEDGMPAPATISGLDRLPSILAIPLAEYAAEHDPPVTRRVEDSTETSGDEFAAIRIDNLQRLPYPVALTASRLLRALDSSTDVLKTLFALKDCFEATVKYCGILLLADYFRSDACTAERNESLLEKMIRPSLGVWVTHAVGDLSRWLVAGEADLRQVASFFVAPPSAPGAKPKPTQLLKRCEAFVAYRNDALGHGAMRRDTVYQEDLAGWLPLLEQLLTAVGQLDSYRLVLPVDRDRCQVWMGPESGTTTEPGKFRDEQIGHFAILLGGQGEAVRDLYPFVCYVPDTRQQQQLHFYDSIYRYRETRKEVSVLDYDEGFKQATPEPVSGLEQAFTSELLASAFKRHSGRMEVIEGRVANFGELLGEHAEIVGRRFAIDHVKKLIEDKDRGLLVIEAEPGKGKTALLAHLIENEFGHYGPRPVHFFYRRTAGITNPDVCVKSLYHSLLSSRSPFHMTLNNSCQLQSMAL